MDLFFIADLGRWFSISCIVVGFLPLLLLAGWGVKSVFTWWWVQPRQTFFDVCISLMTIIAWAVCVLETIAITVIAAIFFAFKVSALGVLLGPCCGGIFFMPSMFMVALCVGEKSLLGLVSYCVIAPALFYLLLLGLGRLLGGT